jgi:hypothetical protein
LSLPLNADLLPGYCNCENAPHARCSKNPTTTLSSCEDGPGAASAFLGYALPWAFAALGRFRSLEAGEESLHRRRAFSSLAGGVSRFDRQTRYYSVPGQDASASQKRVSQRVNDGNHEGMIKADVAGRTKRHSLGSGVLLSRAGHWPPSKSWPEFLPRADRRLIQPVIPLSGRSWADALAGRLLFCGLAGIFQLPVHHWRLLISNQHAVLNDDMFQQFTPQAILDGLN